jgi:hypothetical protein
MMDIFNEKGLMMGIVPFWDKLKQLQTTTDFAKTVYSDIDPLTGDIAKNGNQVCIVLDNVVYSAATAKAAISGGQTQISGAFTLEETADLENVLRAGKLPAKADIVQKAVEEISEVVTIATKEIVEAEKAVEKVVEEVRESIEEAVPVIQPIIEEVKPTKKKKATRLDMRRDSRRESPVSLAPTTTRSEGPLGPAWPRAHSRFQRSGCGSTINCPAVLRGW